MVSFGMTIIAVLMIWFFDRVILLNSLTTLLSGCVWFPQIVYNAKNGVRNTQKMRHVISVQATLSWLAFYLRMNSTGVFKLESQYTFGFFYFSIIGFQMWLLTIQKYWSPKICTPNCCKAFFNRVHYTYTRSELFMSSSEECSICMQKLRSKDQTYEAGKCFVTPCNHSFHKDCLLNWLQRRLECPLCRSQLPAPESDDDSNFSYNSSD